jgi:TPR repeat protein
MRQFWLSIRNIISFYPKRAKASTNFFPEIHSSNNNNNNKEHNGRDKVLADKRARELWETKGTKRKVLDNRRQACALWKTAAASGDVASQYMVATFQLSGEAVEYGILKDVNTALKTLHSLAEIHRHPLANFTLGMIYAYGLSGVPRDFERALSYLKVATVLGVAEAAYYVYVLLMNLNPPSEKEALEYLFRAVNEHKHLMATFTLATRYNEGRGVPLNRQKALQLFLEAADRGLMLAQHSVGVAYYEGLGCRVDERKAVLYFMKAASQGFAPSMRNLAEIYRQGIVSLIFPDDNFIRT